MARSVIQKNLQELLNSLEEIERETPVTSGDAFTLLGQKKKLATRALTLLDDSRLIPAAQVSLAKEYLSLIMERGQRYQRESGQKTYRPLKSRTEFLISGNLLEKPVFLKSDFIPERKAIFFARGQVRSLIKRTAKEMKQTLMKDLSLAPRTIALTAADMVASPVYLVYIMVYGQTLDGQDATVVERLLAGLDLVPFKLNTPPRSKRLKRINSKHHEINRIRSLAEEFGIGMEVMDLDTLRAVAATQRWQPNDTVLRRLFTAPIPEALRGQMHAVLQRISDSRLVRKLRAKLIALDAKPLADKRKKVARDVGSLIHWKKYLEEQDYWEKKFRDGTAVKTGKNRYREARKAGDETKLGDLEVMFEWTITDTSRRLDYAMINHSEKTICITDLTGQLKQDHLAKTKGYGSLVRRLDEFKNFKVIKAVEMYWDEKAGKYIEGLADHF